MGKRYHPASCRHCGLHRDEIGHISARGLCQGCADFFQLANADAMRGPGDREMLLNWRRRLAASIGAVLVDDLQAQTGRD